MNLTTQPAGGRGCGSRNEGGVYGCCGVGPEGLPWHAFMLDPPVPYYGDVFRGVQYAEDIMPELIPDDWPRDRVMLVDWVGKQFYETAPTFMEEVRRYGLSRNFGGFDYQRLDGRTPHLVLLHGRAGIGWEDAETWSDGCDWQTVENNIKMKYCRHVSCVEEHGYTVIHQCAEGHYPACTYHLWPLVTAYQEIDEEMRVSTPWGSYDPMNVVEHGYAMDPMAVATVLYPQATFSPAAFAMLPISHIEAVGYLPEDSKAPESGLEIAVVEE